MYDKQFQSNEGRPAISGRVVLGALIIKHILHLTDEETIHQIEENMFMQYFLGYSSFTNESIFSPTLFVEIRKRLDLSIVNSISEIVAAHHNEIEDKHVKKDHDKDEFVDTASIDSKVKDPESEANKSGTNAGTLIMDATVAPQNITYPTDLKLLNAAREKSEELIDKLYCKEIHGSTKVRTYRELARKDFLNAIKKKTKSFKEIYKFNGHQIRYLKRNNAHIQVLLKGYEKEGLEHPLKKKRFTILTHLTNCL